MLLSDVVTFSGITTQEYAPVLPHAATSMGHHQPEPNGYAPVHSPAHETEENRYYADAPNGYDQSRGMENLHLSEGAGNYLPQGQNGYGQSHDGQGYYPEGVSSYDKVRGNQRYNYGRQAGILIEL